MLKHKIRKSRKNILSLLESVNVGKEEKKDKTPEYSEVRKRGEKAKIKNERISKYCIYCIYKIDNTFPQMKVTTLRKVMIASLRTGQGVKQEQKRRENLPGMRRHKPGKMCQSAVW